MPFSQCDINKQREIDAECKKNLLLTLLFQRRGSTEQIDNPSATKMRVFCPGFCPFEGTKNPRKKSRNEV